MLFLNMYTKEERKLLSISFWNSFGEACKPFLSRHNKKKWLTYNTKIKGIELKFFAGRDKASVILEINHKNEDVRLFIFELLHGYKAILNDGLDRELMWHLIFELPNGKEVSRAEVCIANVDLHKQSDWPAMYEFMMNNMLLLENNFLDIADSVKIEVTQFIGNM